MKIKEVVNALEEFAPLPLQEDYDNAGLQVGLTETEVSGALLCLDVTEEVVDEAVAKGCNLIVSHHPLIFRALKRVTGANMVQRCVMKAIMQSVAIVSMHTNLDNAIGGVNYKMAEKLHLRDLSILAPRETGGVSGGSGVVGSLEQPMEAAAFIAMLKETFQVSCVQTNQLLHRPIRRVGLCGGAGAFLLGEAVAAGADAFITGEMHYHDFFDYEQEVQVCVIGHYESEQYTTEIFKQVMEERCPDVRCILTEVHTNPIVYM